MYTILLFLAATNYVDGQILPVTQITIDIVDVALPNNYDFQFKSTVRDCCLPTIYPLNISFSGGSCYRPLISIMAELIDIDGEDEYLQFYQREWIEWFPYLIGQCGDKDDRARLMNGSLFDSLECGNYTQCAENVDLTCDLEDKSVESLALFIYKSDEVDVTCNDTQVSVNFTITCQTEPTPTPSVICDCGSDAPVNASTGDVSVGIGDRDGSSDESSSSSAEQAAEQQIAMLAKSIYQQESAIFPGEDDDDRKYDYNVNLSQGTLINLICMISFCLLSIFCIGLVYFRDRKNDKLNVGY